VLAEAEVVASDGTFNIRPKPKKKWRQVYSLHTYVNGTFIPCAVAYMTSKSRHYYKTMLRSLRTWMHDNLETAGGEPQEWEPKYWLTDFESGIFPAVKEMWPNSGIVQKGCYFHYTQAIWSHRQRPARDR
jgi:hypothetical protein